MEGSSFDPAGDPRSAAFHATRELMRRTVAGLEKDDMELLDEVLDAGGRAGIRVLTDKRQQLSLSLIVEESNSGFYWVVGEAAPSTPGYREAANAALALIFHVDCTLPAAKREELYRVAEDGGWFGVELLADRRNMTHAELVVFGPSGDLAETLIIGPRPTLH